MSETGNTPRAGDSRREDSVSAAAPPSNAGTERQNCGTVRKLLNVTRAGVELCGKHPFATGLFALLGLIGLGLSVYSFLADLESTRAGAEHVQRVEDKLAAIESKVGQPHNGGVFLYEEPVEIYWNNWWAHSLTSPAEVKEIGQAEQTIIGDGKTVDFVGVLSMNCENGKHRWRGVQNFNANLSEAETKDLVPQQVIRNAYKLFCNV